MSEVEFDQNATVYRIQYNIKYPNCSYFKTFSDLNFNGYKKCWEAFTVSISK